MSTHGRLSDYQSGLFIAELLALDLWWGLANGNPFTADPLTVEILGGAYVRPDAPLASYGTTGGVNDGPVAFHAIPAGAHVTHVMLFDDPVGGNMRAAAELWDFIGDIAAPEDFPVGGSWTIPDGEIVVGIDVPGL